MKFSNMIFTKQLGPVIRRLYDVWWTGNEHFSRSFHEKFVIVRPAQSYQNQNIENNYSACPCMRPL